MKFSNVARKLIATGCCGALVAAWGVTPAFANTTQAYDVPTQETSVYNADGARYATATGQHGSAVVGEYAGLSEVVNEIYATTGNGVSTSNYKYNPYFGIFGSSANENPDPYTANLFYNWYVEETNAAAGATQLQKSDNAMVNLLFTSSKGSSIVTDESVTSEGTSYTLQKRPDVLVLHSTGIGQFDSQIKAINEQDPSSEYYKAASDTYIGDDKYDPIEVSYAEDNCLTQINNMWATAKAADQVEKDAQANNLKIVTRYGDSLETAKNYELYTKGSVLYTLAKIDDGTIQKKTVAYVKGIQGTGKDATVTLYSEPDPSTSREMAHHIECTVATANNLANVLHPELERETKMQSVTCSVEELAQADVIILADPDNMAYNFGGIGEDGTQTKPNWVKSVSTSSAENNWGQEATRSDGEGHYKNEFYGTQEATNTMVSNIKAALNDLGTADAKALAQKNIMSCVQEGSSSSDGGSIEAMSQYGIINAFIYPEIASGVNQYGWYLDNIAHIKTSSVASMVNILCQDMSLADGAKLSDIDNYSQSTSDAITETYEIGMLYYLDNKAQIDDMYPWLTPTEDMSAVMPTALTQTIKVSPASKTVKASAVKKKAKTYTIKVTGAQTKLEAAKLSSSAKKGIKKVTVSGKNKVNITVKKGAKKGTYKVKVRAKKSYAYGASAYKTITVTVK